MVETRLTPELIEEGAILLRELDSTGIPPRSAFWLFSPETADWKLVLGESGLGEAGPKKFYREIQRTLNAHRDSIRHLSLHDVSVVRTDAPVITSLSRVIATNPDAGGPRSGRNAADGTRIKDAYIYRLRKAA